MSSYSVLHIIITSFKTNTIKKINLEFKIFLIITKIFNIKIYDLSLFHPLYI